MSRLRHSDRSTIPNTVSFASRFASNVSVNRSPSVAVIGRPDLGLWFSSIIIAILCTPALLRIALSVPLHLSLNYNEGWNAYHAAEVMRGATLYPAAPRFFFNNYPPLSFYALAGSSHVFGDSIVAGRWISLAAFLVWTALLQPVSGVLGCRSDEARFAALIFAANMLVFTDYVGINDPELLGHAVGGLGLLTVSGVRERRGALAYPRC